MNEQLKPCPYRNAVPHKHAPETSTILHRHEYECSYVECLDCGATGPKFWDDRDGKKAIAAWNAARRCNEVEARLEETGRYPQWKIAAWAPNVIWGIYTSEDFYFEAEQPEYDCDITDLWVECSDDCRLAGYEVDPELNGYVFGDLPYVEYPTRCRPLWRWKRAKRWSIRRTRRVLKMEINTAEIGL